MLALRLLLLLIGVWHFGGEILADSDLRSALDAIDRRQRELAEYEEAQQYGINSYEQPEELSFLNNNAADSHSYDKDYMDDEGYDPYNKRLTSSFRERLEEDRERQLEELARNLYNNLENSGIERNNAKDVWERYYGNNGLSYVKNNALNKRYYALYGTKNSVMRKRGRYIDNNDEPIYSIHHHVPRADESDYKMNYMNRHIRKAGNHPHNYNKYYMLSKRSSTSTKEEKRSVKKQTDPKVEKDLSIIFGAGQGDLDTNNLGEGVSSSTEKPLETTKKPEETPPTRKIEKKDKPKMDVNKETDINKEIFEPVAPQKSKELKLKKKSIDWSDYFGLDRRKKSEDDGLDKEWLMERYHKAIAVSAKKRNAEVRNHDATPLKKDDPHEKQERKITEMDKKLEKLEDEIVEDALKYTGARQDEEDSKEIQQIKDNIISRLAQAYNIEKMRNALEEYKMEIEKSRKEVEKNKGEDKLFPEYTMEEKRLSVPRKEAVDDSGEVVDGDNNIKCTNSGDCHEQNYKLPSDILDNQFSNLNYECPALQRACNDVASIVGYYGHVFEAACHVHQMCLLCSNNSWFSPTRQCNALFLTKAYELCLGKEECKKEARHSVRYLIDINESLQAQTTLSDQCELQCPEVLSK